MVREELLILASCLLRPMSRNSVAYVATTLYGMNLMVIDKLSIKECGHVKLGGLVSTESHTMSRTNYISFC